MVQRNGRSPSTSLHCYNQQYAKSYLTHVQESIEKSSVPMKVKVSVRDNVVYLDDLVAFTVS